MQLKYFSWVERDPKVKETQIRTIVEDVGEDRGKSDERAEENMAAL